MTRRPTYGERMAAWEAEQDERDWKRRMEGALISVDLDSIRSLVDEGMENGYSFNEFPDNTLIKHFLSL